jgi:hypothetical protein
MKKFSTYRFAKSQPFFPNIEETWLEPSPMARDVVPLLCSHLGRQGNAAEDRRRRHVRHAMAGRAKHRASWRCDTAARTEINNPVASLIIP